MGWKHGPAVTTIFVEERFTLTELDFAGEKQSSDVVLDLAFKRAVKLGRERFAAQCAVFNKDPEQYDIASWNSSYASREPSAVTISVSLTYAEKVFP